MSNTNKYVADLIKVCSVLPVFAVAPAMADAAERQTFTSGETFVITNQSVSGHNETAEWAGGLYLVSKQSELTIRGGRYTNNANNAIILNKDGSVYARGAGGVVGQGTGLLKVQDYDGQRASFVGNSAIAAGGALWLGDRAEITNSDFIGNKVVGVEDTAGVSIDGGGALFLGATSKTVLNDVLFNGNSSAVEGGAISMRSATQGNNSQAKLDIFDSDFIGNTAVTNGGAIYSTFYDSETVKNSVYINDTDFTSNFAKNGGAIYVEGLADLGGGKASMKVVDADFERNTATEMGGAVYNASNLTLTDADFASNTAGNGGAIFNKGLLTVDADSEFIGNTAALGGGAIYNGLNATIDVLSADFKSNSVMYDNGGHASGGAIYNGGKLGDVVGVFNDNKSTATGDGYTAKGGAIYSWADKSAHATIDSIIADFNGNSANSMGTYGFAMGGAVVNDGVLGKLYAANTGFVNNTSNAGYVAYAGAFYNSEYAHVSELVADFVGNSADATFFAVGGALANKGKIDYLSGTFSNNILKNAQYSQGGAIFNGSNPDDDSLPLPEITIVDSVFANNVIDAADADWAEGGAIYNELNSFVTMKGTNTFTGNTVNGKANDIYNDGTFTIASGMTSIDGGINGAGALDIKSGATLNMNYASIEQDSIIIDGTLMASLLNANDKVDISGALSGTGSVLLSVGATGVYDLGELKRFVTEDSFGSTYNVSLDDNKIATLTVKQAAEIAKETGITGGAAGAVSAFATSSDTKLQAVSLAVQEALNNGDVALVEKEMAKVNPDSKPVGHSVASSVQGQVVAVAAGRMSAVGGGAMGRSGGDVTSAGFWAQGLVNKSKMGSAFQGSTTGFALGGDMLVDNVLTLGGGFAFNSTEIEADGRDTDVESNSVFAYAQYKPSKWFVNGTVSYTLSDYTDDARVFGGDVINNQYDTKAFGAQAIFGYDFASGVSPEVGLRYLYVSQEEHVDGLNRVIKEMNSDVLTGIAGLKYAFAIESDTAVKFSPSLRAAMTYDFVTPDSVATIVVPGTAPYYVDIDSLSRMGGEFGIGLTAEYRGLELSLNYELDLHKDYTSQTGLFKFRYNF